MQPKPGQNIEVKARYADLEMARGVCQDLQASFQGVLDQIDTYFQTDNGRLKLRQINGERAELIEYTRSNEATARASHYSITHVQSPHECLTNLQQSHRHTCTVRKRRELYLWHNVRIHLDTVEGLGSFIEFEGVVGPDADEELSRQRVDRLVGEFGIEPGDQIGVSYSDLLLAK